MDYEDAEIRNLINRINKDREEIVFIVDSIVKRLIKLKPSADYLYSKEINKLYFLIGCGMIQEDLFIKEFKKLTKVLN